MASDESMAPAPDMAEEGGELFERPSFREGSAEAAPSSSTIVPTGATPAAEPPAGAMALPSPQLMPPPQVQPPQQMFPGTVAGSSLFDRYASDPSTVVRRDGGNGSTFTSRLRASGIKLACYLNTECNRGRAYIIQLPGTCDTLGEVFPMVQRKMGLDGRMLYAAELFLPDGEKIRTFQQLREASEIDTAVIVGCGEPFDPSTIPQSMLSFHVHGGGRTAPRIVKKELAEKKMRGAQLKADQVRASGHGINSEAAIAARIANQETNRSQAAEMRHEYMNQLIGRAQQQTELIRSVQANNARLRTDRQRREQAKKSVWSQDRIQDLAESRRHESNVFQQRHELEQSRFTRIQSQAKLIRANRNAGAKLAKDQLNEQRRAAGLERRLSYVQRTVEKAERENKLVASHQDRLLERRMPMSSRAGRSPLSSTMSGF